ncbi:hypothetical protein MRX96_010465 [Rhipicephalus microplus]
MEQLAFREDGKWGETVRLESSRGEGCAAGGGGRGMRAPRALAGRLAARLGGQPLGQRGERRNDTRSAGPCSTASQHVADWRAAALFGRPCAGSAWTIGHAGGERPDLGPTMLLLLLIVGAGISGESRRHTCALEANRGGDDAQ